MPQGLQVWDENGVLKSDTNTTFGRFLGTIIIPYPTGNASGSVTHPGFAYGTPIWIMAGTTSSYVVSPIIQVEGTTLTWSYNFDGIGGTYIPPSGMRSAIRLTYGVK